MSSTRCGISAKQLGREIGVGYKTAWRMFNLIRSLLQEDELIGGAGTTVEADETYVGPRRKRGTKRGRPAPNDPLKTPVVASVERGGRVVARVVPNVRVETVQGHIRQHVLPSTMVYTDEYVGYRGIDARGYKHRRVHHLQNVYVSGDVHTNTIEGFFGLVKTGIRGVYHSVSKKHLQGYLDEYSFRYNRRRDRQPIFWSILERVEQRRLPAGQHA